MTNQSRGRMAVGGPHRWGLGGRAMVLALVGWLVQAPSHAQGPPLPSKVRLNPAKLVGRWQRQDGGYILEIRGVAPDGKLEALYLNPRPIHIARAEWRQKDPQLGIFVELRDTNYPGSTYTLMVSADGQRLTGKYFQATQKVDYAVEFLRLEEAPHRP